MEQDASVIMESSFNYNLFSPFGTSELKVEPVHLSQIFIEMYHMFTVLSLILLVSEMFRVRKAKAVNLFVCMYAHT